MSTLGTGDITVTGPGGYNVTATYVGVNIATDGTPRVATYTITPPGGSWDSADAGTFTINVGSSQVTDMTESKLK